PSGKFVVYLLRGDHERRPSAMCTAVLCKTFGFGAKVGVRNDQQMRSCLARDVLVVDDSNVCRLGDGPGEGNPCPQLGGLCGENKGVTFPGGLLLRNGIVVGYVPNPGGCSLF